MRPPKARPATTCRRCFPQKHAFYVARPPPYLRSSSLLLSYTSSVQLVLLVDCFLLLLACLVRTSLERRLLGVISWAPTSGTTTRYAAAPCEISHTRTRRTRTIATNTTTQTNTRPRRASPRSHRWRPRGTRASGTAAGRRA